LKKRFHYFILTIAIIIIGLLSRQSIMIPLYIGDALYALMMYFIVRFIFLQRPPRFIFLLSLSICIAIEFSQLLHAGWINTIRATLSGRLILGQGFLWSDLVAYAVGAALGWLIDKYLLNKSTPNSRAFFMV
jgi:hypothetical protein